MDAILPDNTAGVTKKKKKKRKRIQSCWLPKPLSHFFSFFFFKLWKYDNTITGDLENIEQGYI